MKEQGTGNKEQGTRKSQKPLERKYIVCIKVVVEAELGFFLNVGYILV